MILLSGATGKTGRSVLAALAAHSEPVRAWVRLSEQGSLVRALGAAETFVGDMASVADWQQGMTGVRSVYHICPNMHPAEIEIGQMAIAAARQSRLDHFVYHSVLHPQVEAMPHHWQKMRVEEMLFASGMPFTVLQPAAYMQNVLAEREAIETEGIFRVPYPVSTRLSLVDLQDVAAAAAAVITGKGHQNVVYELVGEAGLTQTAVSDILSNRLNHSVRAEEISLSVWEQQAIANGLGDYQIESLLKMFRYYARFNFQGNTNVLRWLLKREPTSFATFVERIFAVS